MISAQRYQPPCYAAARCCTRCHATALPYDPSVFNITPTHYRLEARTARHATRSLGERLDAWHAGGISFAEFDASVQGWVNHVRHADTCALLCAADQ